MSQHLVDLSYRMGRLEAEIRDVLDCKGDIHYARSRISELLDSIIEIYKRLNSVYDNIQNMQVNMDNLYGRILEIEKRVFGQK
jgi:hypothetical protein